MKLKGLTEKKKIEALNRRLATLKKKRQPWENDWEEAAEIFNPRRERLTDPGGKNEQTGLGRYDSWPVLACQQHANGMQGNLISSAQKWFKLKFRKSISDEVPFARDWIENAGEEIYSVLSSSNFYATMGTILMDAGSICTSVTFTDWDADKKMPIFKAINPGETWIAEDSSEWVNTVFREFVMTAIQIAEKFENIPESVQLDLDNEEYDQEYTVTHAVLPREDRENEKLNSKNMPFSSFYYITASEDMLSESGFMEFPYHVWRYDKASGELYGRGPGMQSLQEGKRLNKYSKNSLRLADLLLNPPMNIPNTAKGKFSFNPGARNYYNAATGKPEPMQVAGNLEAGAVVVQDIRETVKKFFHVDYFMMMQNAEREMTAREVIERQGEKASVLISVVGRMYHELIKPMIIRVFGLLYRNGTIGNPPPAIMEMGATIEIDLMGTLAMAQKYYTTQQGINKGIQALAPLLQLDPNVADMVNFDEVASAALQSAGMPEKAIREKPEIERIRKAKAQAAAEQKQIEQMGQMAEMVPNLNQPVNPKSPLEGLSQQAAAAMNGGRG